MVAYATRAEVYAAVALGVTGAVTSTVRCSRDPTPRHGLTAVLWLTLTATVHPILSATVAVPSVIAIVFRLGSRCTRLFPIAVAFTALGTASYYYLTLRAAAPTPPQLVWGNPIRAHDLATVAFAPAYRGNFDVVGLSERLFDLWRSLGNDDGWLIVGVGFAGLGIAMVERRAGAGVCAAVAGCSVAFAATQKHYNPDIKGYLIPSLLAATPGVSCWIAWTQNRWGRHCSAARAVTAATLVGAIVSTAVRATPAGRRDHRSAAGHWDASIGNFAPRSWSVFRQRRSHPISRPNTRALSPALGPTSL